MLRGKYEKSSRFKIAIAGFKISMIITKFKHNFSLLALLFFASAYLLLTNLDSRSLWTGDEATSVFVSRAVAKYGLPFCFYEDKIIEDEKLWCKNNIYTEYLWLHNYVGSVGILLLGFSVFSARLPFAIFGIIFVLLTYYITKKYTNNTNLAFLTSTAALATIYYLLLFRIARYYGVALVLGILFIDAYHELIKNNKQSYFLIISTLMILNHFGMFLVQMTGVLAYHFALFFRNKFPEKRYLIYKTILLIPPIIIFFVTFVFLGQENIVAHHTEQLTASTYANNFYYFVASFFRFFLPLPLLLIFLLFIPVKKHLNDFVLFNAVILITGLFVASFRGEFYYAYIPAGYSILFLLSHTIYSIYEEKKWLGLVLGIVVLFTNFLHIIPFCTNQQCDFKSPFFEYVFYELQERYADPQELITDYFNNNVPKGGTLTYGGSEAIAIYYFTKMNVTPTGRSDYAVYFNASLDPTSKYDLVKEFNYTSLFPQGHYLDGHPEFQSFEFKGKSPFLEDHLFFVESTKTFRLYKLKNTTRGSNANN